MSTGCFFVTPFNYSAGYPANSVSGATLRLIYSYIQIYHINSPGLQADRCKLFTHIICYGSNFLNILFLNDNHYHTISVFWLWR